MEEEFCLLSTLRVESRRCCLLSLHLDRFTVGATALDFALDRGGLEQALVAAAAGYKEASPAQLRVTVARNGFHNIETPQPLPRKVATLYAMLSSEPVMSKDPLLPYSTTRRPIYDEALSKANRLGMVDVLFQNEQGKITEGANHSIFIRRGKRWLTPFISSGVLAGVFRKHLLETMESVVEEDFDRNQLLNADEVWLTNAVYGARRVSLVPTTEGQI